MASEDNTRLIQFCIRVPLTWLLIYLAFIEQSEGAYNVIHALAWIGVMITPFLFSSAAQSDLKNHPVDWIYNADRIDDILIVFVFIWFGSIATGIAWLIATFIAVVAKGSAQADSKS